MAEQKRLWERGWTKGTTTQASVEKSKEAGTPRVYTLQVFLIGGPITKAFAGKEISRTIQIRGDQTLQTLHQAIFQAFDRFEEHFYEFQIGGKGPHDPKAQRYVLSGAFEVEREEHGEGPAGVVTQTTVGSLGLKVGQAFGYWFDFGDDWWHQINVIARGEPGRGGRYPKAIKRVGESPPQYAEWDEDAEKASGRVTRSGKA